jgi:hypothetical protein
MLGRLLWMLAHFQRGSYPILDLNYTSISTAYYILIDLGMRLNIQTTMARPYIKTDVSLTTNPGNQHLISNNNRMPVCSMSDL